MVNHAPTRKSIACFGAVGLQSGKFIHVMSPKFNAATFEAYLRKLLRHRSRNKKMVVVLDNARYHHAKLLKPLLEKHRSHLELLFLPPYCPPVGTRRASLETRAKAGNAQSVLRRPGGTANGGRVLLQRMAGTQFGAAKTMRHYLGRYV